MAHSIHYGSLLVAAAMVALLAAGQVDGIGFNLHHRSSPLVRRRAGTPPVRGGRRQQQTARRSTSLLCPATIVLSSPAVDSPPVTIRVNLPSPTETPPSNLKDSTCTSSSLFLRASQLDPREFILAPVFGRSLHYAEVAVGLPNAMFLAALDTGSDLFWVPCDNATVQDSRQYSPSRSLTSKTVTCEHPLCDRPKACATRNSSCPYTVRYAPANGSSSGVLIEDVLHLSRERMHGASEAVLAPVVFGCGREQAGAFLGGVMGLGTGKVSVPSLITSSFSMCFSNDGVSRINFGDAVSLGQAQTPFILRNTFNVKYNSSYNIHTMGMNVENLDVPLEFDAVVDSGTAFTYLTDTAYIAFAFELMSQIQDKRANLSASVPFEYCYGLSPNQTEIHIPDVSFLTKGGAKFPVTRPFFVIADRHTNGAVGYCLGILKSETDINIFGQNFMTGLKVVFDRERFVLGWSKFDCYRDVEMEDVGSADPAPATASAPATA